MTKPTDAQHDPLASIMIEEGVYPAHIVGFEVREDHPTKVGISDIFSLQYKLAPEAEKLEQECHRRGVNGNFAFDENKKRIPLLDGDGNTLKISCKQFVGRKLYANGLFLFKGAEGSGRNTKYAEFLDLIGIELETVEIEGHKVKQLLALEEDDVLGKAVFVQVAYKPNKKGDFYPTVVDIMKWEDGKPISIDEAREDLPF